VILMRVLKITGVLVVAILVLALPAWPQTQTFYFPQIADGTFPGGFYTTTVFVTNPASSGTANVTITFTQSDGTAFNVGFVDSNGQKVGAGNVVSLTLAGGQSRKLLSTADLTIAVGFATVTSDAPIRATTVFSQFSGTPGQGTLLGEAAVTPADTATSQGIFIDETGNFKTALALANPSQTTPANLIFDLNAVNADGVAVLTTTRQLQATGHRALFVNELFSTDGTNATTHPLVAGHVGTMNVTSDTEVALVSLRFSGPLFTTVPPFSLPGSVPSGTALIKDWLDNPSWPITVPAVRNNFVDEVIFQRIEAARIEAAPLSSDAEFLRRVTLDLTGRIPTADDVVAFVEDTRPTKRESLIESLLVSTEFVDKWTMFFGDLLKLNGPASNVNRYTQGRDAFYLYLKESIAGNKGYDQIARELITATGDNHSNGAVNFPVGGTVPMGPVQDTYDGMAVQVASMFLGIQTVDCLLCHDGATRLDTVNLWASKQTRRDMWGLSAFFANTFIRRERISDQPRLIRYTVGDFNRPREYRLDTTDGNRSSRQPLGDVADIQPAYPFELPPGSRPRTVLQGENRRAALAEMITADPQFSRAAVNYIWEELMVQAFVSPSDGFDPARLDPSVPLPGPWTVQPTNPQLLEELTSWFQLNDYDLRGLIGVITKSRTYQLSTKSPTIWKPEYVPYYARRVARRLDAEEIHDAITRATGVGANYRITSRTGSELPNVGWAMQLPDTKEPRTNRSVRLFLDSLGRGNRDDTVRSNEGAALQALNLMNHDFVNSRINSRNRLGTIAKILAQTSDPAEIIEQLYLATLSRYPRADEVALLLPVLETQGLESGAESVQWILINTMDFIFNH
jgi:hypothetical protein